VICSWRRRRPRCARCHPRGWTPSPRRPRRACPLRATRPGSTPGAAAMRLPWSASGAPPATARSPGTARSQERTHVKAMECIKNCMHLGFAAGQLSYLCKDPRLDLVGLSCQLRCYASGLMKLAGVKHVVCVQMHKQRGSPRCAARSARTRPRGVTSSRDRPAGRRQLLTLPGLPAPLGFWGVV
jgi:hypothetical protein